MNGIFCPDCGKSETMFNLLLSYENGRGEVYYCRVCRKSFEYIEDDEDE